MIVILRQYSGESLDYASDETVTINCYYLLKKT